MKRILNLSLIALCAVMVLASCGEPESETKTLEVIHEIPAEIDHKKQDFTVEIKSNTSWTISDFPSWCDFSRTKGTGDMLVTITVSANKTVNYKEPRTGSFTVKAANTSDKIEPQTISFKQNVNPGKTIPDAAFLNYLSSNDYVTVLSAEEGAVLITKAGEDATNFDLSGLGISSLDGLRFFPNLEVLNTSMTSVRHVDLSHNPKVHSFAAYTSALTSIDLSNSANLYVLEVDGNFNLASVDVTNCPKLERLTLAGTKIKTVDVTQNPNLQELFVQNLEITSLDVTQNPNLKLLYVFETEISSLDLSNNPLLEKLACQKTKITSLDLSANPKMVELMCYGLENFETLNIAGCNDLVDLNIAFNSSMQQSYTVLSEAGVLELSAVSFAKNIIVDNITKITKINSNGNKTIETLSVQDCTGVTECTLKNNTKLKTVYTNGLPVSITQSGNSADYAEVSTPRE